MTARPMTEGERERARRNALELAKSIDEMDAFALTKWLDNCAIGDIELIARALLSTSSAVRGMREALEAVMPALRDAADTMTAHGRKASASELEANIRIARAALSLEGEDKQARSPSALSAPISTDTKDTTK